MTRGYFGIGVYRPKATVNIGTLWRHAWLYGADFIFTIGARYRHQPGDTVKAPRQIPLYAYDEFDEFAGSLPHGCQIVCVEQALDAKPLHATHHPERAAYMLGAEDSGIPPALMVGRQKIVIPSVEAASMNVANAGTLVMYDRHVKQLLARPSHLAVAS